MSSSRMADVLYHKECSLLFLLYSFFSPVSTGSANRWAMCDTGASDWKIISVILSSHEYM